MSTPIEVLESEVLALSPSDRAHLLERLIVSLDADPEIQKAWVVEAARREAQLANGAATLTPGDEALARLRAKLQ